MKKYIVANWKSQKNLAQVESWFHHFPRGKENQTLLHDLEVIVALPTPFLQLARTLIDEQQLPIQIAVQDISPFGPGAFTGEVCPENIADFHVAYSLVGHSERRRFLHEKSQLVADKTSECLRSEITPIICVDEPYLQEQRRFLTTQQIAESFLAYEPVTAIGSGQAESVENLSLMKATIYQWYGHRPFLYGGSVHAGNIADYLAVSDGVLVGTASLQIRDFIDLLYSARQGLEKSA